MEKIIYYPLLDLNRTKAQKLHQEVLYNTNSELEFTDYINKANVILVGGGDGFLLDSISKYSEYGKIFFGINCGTRGFLLNQLDSINQLPVYLNQIEVVEENPIKCHVNLGNETITKYSINDIVLGSDLGGMFSFEVSGKDFEYKVKGTGLLISTAIGCTGYWLSGGGPLLPLRGNLWGIMGMFALPFSYDLKETQNILIVPISRYKINILIDGKNGIKGDIKEIKLMSSSQKIKLGFLDYRKFENTRLELYIEKIGFK